MSNGRSVTKVLLWKEWRQLRLLFAALVGMGTLAAVSGLVWKPFYAAALAGLLAACAGPVLLASSAFSGEVDAGTEGFLDALPCSRLHVYRTRLAAVLGLSLSGAAFVITLGALVVYGVRGESFGQVDHHVLAAIPFVMVLEVAAVATVASLKGRMMVTAMVATGLIIVQGLAGTWVCTSVERLSSPVWAAAVAGPALLVLLMRTDACHRGRGQGMLVRVRRITAALVLPPLVLLLLGAGVWWLNTIPRKAIDVHCVYAPGDGNGRHCLLEEGYPDQATVLDVDTGELRPVSRIWCTYPASPRPWSPDGTRCLLAKGNMTVVPVPFCSQLWQYEFWLLDAESGEATGLPDIPWKGELAWFDNRTVCAGWRAGNSGVVFVDVVDAVTSVCGRSNGHAFAPGTFDKQEWPPGVYRSGMFVSPGAAAFVVDITYDSDPSLHTWLAIGRYHPSRTSSETQTFSLPEQPIHDVAALPDGDTILIWGDERLTIASFTSGEWRDTTLPGDVAARVELELSRQAWHRQGVTGVFPDGCFIVAGRGVHTFRTDTDTWSEYRLPPDWPGRDVPGRPESAVPSADGLHLLVKGHGGVVRCAAVLQLNTGEWSPVHRGAAYSLTWHGDEHLMEWSPDIGVVTMDRDMGNRQQVFPR